jgi:hypothetical protein
MRRVSIVRLDRLDNEIEFIGAVDLPGHAVILAWRDGVGFGEVIEPVNAPRRVISHDEHNTRAAFRRFPDVAKNQPATSGTAS